MKWITAFFLVLVVLISGGCNSPVGCGGVYWETPNPSYAGRFVGSYKGQSGDTQEYNIDMTVTNAGSLSGTLSKAGTSSATAVTGRLVDFQNGCDRGIVLQVSFQFDGESERQINGRRTQRVLETWKFASTLYEGMDNPISKADLVITKS